jgi:peptide subunit release factor 1 (eRF1)
VKRSLYRCDKTFQTDYLLDLYKTYDTYAIALISGKRTDFYTYSKNNIVFVQSMKSDLPNQHKTGGSSAPRFGRIRDEKISCHIKKVLETMVRIFCSDGIFDHIGLYIGGPAELKEKIKAESLFELYFSKHLIQTLTIGEINDQTINQVVKIIEQKGGHDSTMSDLYIKTFEELLSNPNTIDLIIFGTENVLGGIENNIVAEIYVVANHEYLLSQDNLIKTNIIHSNSFAQRYGELVGIKYFACDSSEINSSKWTNEDISVVEI